MSIVSRAQSRSFAATRRLRGVPVVFTRGDDISIEMERIVQGRTEWKGLGKGGAVVISESADFFVPAAELVWNDEILKPEEGDKFTVQTETLVSVYDAQPFGPDRLLHRWHDRSGRTVRRVFTKLFSEDPV